MAFDWKKILGGILPIAGAVTGNPLLATAGGAAGGALSGGGWKGALAGGATGGLSSYLLGGKGGSFNPFKSIFGGSSNTGIGSSGWTKQVVGNSPFSGITQAGRGFAVNSLAKQPTSRLGFGSGLTKNPLLLGLGTMVGSQFINSPKVPELPQSIIDFQNQAKQGNPLQSKAQEALMDQLNQTKQGLGQDEIDAINRQYDISQENELKSVADLYRSVRPGSDPLTDTAYQKDLGRVRDRYATLRADSLAQANRQISNDFNAQRAQQIASAAGLSNQQMQQLSTLGQYDLDRQLMQLQITDRDRQTLRDYLLQFGGSLASSSFQPENPLLQLLGGGY